jgi:hypothetical protein
VRKGGGMNRGRGCAVMWLFPKYKKADYNDKMAECVHVPKLNEIHTGQASSCAVLTTIAFLP